MDICRYPATVPSQCSHQQIDLTLYNIQGVFQSAHFSSWNVSTNNVNQFNNSIIYTVIQKNFILLFLGCPGRPYVLLMMFYFLFLADRTNGRAYATVLRLSSVRPSVTLCIVAKRCILEQKLLLRAYRKSYMRNRLVPKSMTLTFV